MRETKNPSTKVHTAFKQNESDNEGGGGIPMNQLGYAVEACSFLKHRHLVITKMFESCFLKRQACKRDELRLP